MSYADVEKGGTPGAGGEWEHGLFAIDCPFCIKACICFPCTMGTMREAFDETPWAFACCGFAGGPHHHRNVIRNAYGIDGSWLTDWAFGALCGLCTLVQLNKEVEKRGKKGKLGDGSQQWGSGLFGCTEDIVGFIFALFIPCVAVGQAREQFDRSDCIFSGLCCFPPVALTNMVREANNIEGSCFNDVILQLFCGPCALSRTVREIKKRAGA